MAPSGEVKVGTAESMAQSDAKASGERIEFGRFKGLDRACKLLLLREYSLEALPARKGVCELGGFLAAYLLQEGAEGFYIRVLCRVYKASRAEASHEPREHRRS